MRLFRRFRLVAALLAAPLALSVPVVALAHGVAHEREHHHAGHDAAHATERGHEHAPHGAGHAAAPAAPSDEDGPEREIAPADHAGGQHGHQSVSQSPAPRLDTPGPALRAPRDLPASALMVLDRIVPPRHDPVAPGEPHTGPPPRLRAPPAR